MAISAFAGVVENGVESRPRLAVGTRGPSIAGRCGLSRVGVLGSADSGDAGLGDGLRKKLRPAIFRIDTGNQVFVHSSLGDSGLAGAISLPRSLKEGLSLAVWELPRA